MSEDKPWEDESLKGAYHAEKARQAKVKKDFQMKSYSPSAPKLSDSTKALDQAGALAKRNKKITKSIGGWSK